MLAQNIEQEEIGRMLVEFASKKRLDEVLDKTKKFRKSEEWLVKDGVDAKAAEFAITSKHPNSVIFISQDESKSTLKPSMLLPFLANAAKWTTVSLFCLNSFFIGGEKSQEWKGLLSVCLNNEK